MTAIDARMLSGLRDDLAAGPRRAWFGGDGGGPWGQLVLAIGSFIACFSVFGSLAAMMPLMTDRLHLDDAQVGLLLALPILVGSALRIPLGIAADRFGGRAMLIAVLSFAIVPAVLIPLARTFVQVLGCAVLLGVPLAIFSVGVAFVSAWHPPRRQGTALGVLGFGNAGHCLALFGAPLAVAHFGYAWGFWTYAIVVGTWLAVVIAFARNAPCDGPVRRRRLADYARPLACRASWILGLFYFLTFGGLLAMTAYLPSFLTLTFGLSRADAGLRAAGFVILATVMRPTGGALSDRIGPRCILLGAFPFVAVMAIFMACPHMITFTIGALGMAVGVGLGNGAVFAMVGQRFRGNVGAVTGLIGAAGALGGFFPPLVLALVHQRTGSFTMGFVLLAVFALVCLAACLVDLQGKSEPHPSAAI